MPLLPTGLVPTGCVPSYENQADGHDLHLLPARQSCHGSASFHPPRARSLCAHTLNLVYTLRTSKQCTTMPRSMARITSAHIHMVRGGTIWRACTSCDQRTTHNMVYSTSLDCAWPCATQLDKRRGPKAYSKVHANTHDTFSIEAIESALQSLSLNLP